MALIGHFASTATGTFEGKTVPVMHACDHDGHTAMLLAAAEALVAVKARCDLAPS